MIYHCFDCKNLAFVVAKSSFIVCFLLACSMIKSISGQAQLSNATDVVAQIGSLSHNLSAAQPSASSNNSDTAFDFEVDYDVIIPSIFDMSSDNPAATERTSATVSISSALAKIKNHFN